MKFTDLFIRRPVVATVVSLIILLAGLQSIRSLNVRQYPRSDIAVVRVETPYVGANADLVRGFITTPLERVIASADGIDYIESSSSQGLSIITVHLQVELRHQRGADADPGEGRAGAQRSAAGSRGARNRADAERHAVRADVHLVLLERTRPEPDHRLPHARRAAEAHRGQRRAEGGHPRCAHLCHAHLAEARSHGRAEHLADGGAAGARGEQLPLRGRA